MSADAFPLKWKGEQRSNGRAAESPLLLGKQKRKGKTNKKKRRTQRNDHSTPLQMRGAAYTGKTRGARS